MPLKHNILRRKEMTKVVVLGENMSCLYQVYCHLKWWHFVYLWRRRPYGQLYQRKNQLSFSCASWRNYVFSPALIGGPGLKLAIIIHDATWHDEAAHINKWPLPRQLVFQWLVPTEGIISVREMALWQPPATALVRRRIDDEPLAPLIYR